MMTSTAGLPLLGNKSQLESTQSGYQLRGLLYVSALIFSAIIVVGLLYTTKVAAFIISVAPSIVAISAIAFAMRTYNLRFIFIPVLETVILAAVLIHAMYYFRIDSLIGQLFQKGSLEYIAFFSFIRAGLFEELVKSAVVARFALFGGARGVAELAVIGVSVGAGFAAFENIHLAVCGSVPSDQLLFVLAIRAISVTPIHIGCTLCSSLLMGEAMMSSRVKAIVMSASALIVPVVFHGLYDFSVLTGDWPLKSCVFGAVFAIFHVGVIRLVCVSQGKGDEATLAASNPV